jgi:hypothetical protein
VEAILREGRAPRKGGSGDNVLHQTKLPRTVRGRRPEGLQKRRKVNSGWRAIWSQVEDWFCLQLDDLVLVAIVTDFLLVAIVIIVVEDGGGFSPGRLRHALGDRQGLLRQGDPGAQEGKRGALRPQGHEEEVHREEGAGEAGDDGARHPHCHRSPLSHQDTRLLPDREEALPRPRVLPRRRALRPPLQAQAPHRVGVRLP